MERETKIDPIVCGEKEQDLVLYYYGELADRERAAVESHTARCEGCRRYLSEIRSLLPLTVEKDEPAAGFWNEYSREMRRKLETSERRSWWRILTQSAPSWSIPAVAMAAVAIMALSLTLGKGLFRTTEIPPEEQALMEVLPEAENLDFFSNMEILDTMDLLESLGAPANNRA